MKIKRTLSLWAAAAAAALVLSGCGSPDPHEPAELQDYRELVQIKEDWTAGVGESLTGLLTPAVTERGIYAAGRQKRASGKSHDAFLRSVKSRGFVNTLGYFARTAFSTSLNMMFMAV